jgi:hypothetical protein
MLVGCWNDGGTPKVVVEQVAAGGSILRDLGCLFLRLPLVTGHHEHGESARTLDDCSRLRALLLR